MRLLEDFSLLERSVGCLWYLATNCNEGIEELMSRSDSISIKVQPKETHGSETVQAKDERHEPSQSWCTPWAVVLRSNLCRNISTCAAEKSYATQNTRRRTYLIFMITTTNIENITPPITTATRNEKRSQDS
jgi:hypothetical protein